MPFIGFYSHGQAMAYGRREWEREGRCRRTQMALQAAVLGGCGLAQGSACFGAAFAFQLAVYGLGLASWVFQDATKLPWHRPRRWGGHEDFHLCALVGDLSNLAALRARGRV